MKFNDLMDSSLNVLNYTGGCSTCPRKLVDFVPATLRDTDIIIVGEAPGANEVEEQEGFIGQTGQFLRSSLEKVGITEDMYSLTNTIHCRPPDNKTPTKREVSCCMNQYTIKEVTGYPIVLLVGAVPANAFFPDERYKNLRNNVVHHPDFPGQRFYTIYHPGYITRNRSREVLRAWEKSLKRLSRILDEDSECPWEIVHGEHSDFMDKLKTILSSKTICFDIETNKLESWHADAKIRSLSVCSNDKLALFCHEDDLVWKQTLDLIGEQLENPDKVIIGHNVGFDVDYMEQKVGVRAKCKLLDTQALYYIAHREKMASLKYLTSRYLDGYRFLIPHPDTQEDIDLLAKYNTEDVIRTIQLAKKQLPRMSKKQKDLLLRVASPSSLALRRLTTTGFLFDLEECSDTHKKLLSEREKIIDLWKEEDSAFNPKKHLDGNGLIWYLYTHRDLPVIKLTKKSRQPSTDKHTLGTLQRQEGEEFLNWLERLKAIEKFENTYIEKYLNGKLVDFDNRVHADYFNTFTKTGRSNSRNPNAQNLPRDDTLRKTEIEGVSVPFSIRRFFTIPDGKVLLHADYSQIELRIGMCLAGDPTGIDAYLTEGDLHQKTAEQIAAGEGREATKTDRTNAKPVNFGLLYCHKNEAYTLKKNAANEWGLSLTDETSKKYADTFFNTYAQIRPWHRKVVQMLRANNGYAETVMGHRWHYPDYNSQNENARDAAEREAINLMCQSPAGYITLYTLYLLQQELIDRGLRSVKTVASIHDSIMAEVPEERLPEAVDALETCVGRVKEWIAPWFVVPLVMEYEIGPNWSDLKELDISQL